FAVSEFYMGVFKCHCSKCRKAFGGASSAAALCREEAFTWLAGEEGVREYRTPSGFLRRFCGSCGSILPQHLPDYAAYWVPAGLLDADPGLTLQRHIHVDSMAPWEVLDPGTPTLQQGFD
ncbi:MAG: GFA family protein, partial [Halioglobus sp.]|nr:GFA family protein [Halioglobus sp.]